MREEVMSASVLFTETTARKEVRAAKPSERQVGGWNPEDFAREQIQGLVRQVFFSNAERPVRQLVFSAVEPETDVRSICRRVGEALAQETAETVALAGEYPEILRDADANQEDTTEHRAKDESAFLRLDATRVRGNLWLVPAAKKNEERLTTAELHSYLCGMRREFKYSIVAGPPARESNQATAMARFADGIILVLSAHRTRRNTARKIVEALEAAQAHILGTVLSDRMFPIPERIYRRL
jgi:hypothetical protein